MGFPSGSSNKESACNAGDAGSTPGSGRSPGGGNGNPLQYSCLEKPMDWEAWRATVHRVSKSQTQLKQLSMHTHTTAAAAAAAAAKALQSCPTLCDPRDGSPPGSPVPGILQARTLEWVAISFSNARNWKVKVKSLSRVRLLATPWTGAHQAPLSMGFSRQEYWSGVPLPSLHTHTLAWILNPSWFWFSDIILTKNHWEKDVHPSYYLTTKISVLSFPEIWFIIWKS